MEFSYFLPVNIQFGWNKVDNVADFAAPYGKKALIVTGRTSAKKSGLYDRVVAKLDAAHIGHVLFDQVDANPFDAVNDFTDVVFTRRCEIQGNHGVQP